MDEILPAGKPISAVVILPLPGEVRLAAADESQVALAAILVRRRGRKIHLRVSVSARDGKSGAAQIFRQIFFHRYRRLKRHRVQVAEQFRQ